MNVRFPTSVFMALAKTSQGSLDVTVILDMSWIKVAATAQVRFM